MSRLAAQVGQAGSLFMEGMLASEVPLVDCAAENNEVATRGLFRRQGLSISRDTLGKEE